MSVEAPLFGYQGSSAEACLLKGQSGTWAERAAWLLKELVGACGLEAKCVMGYFRHGGLLPGQQPAAHNHCWSGIKVRRCSKHLISCGRPPKRGLAGPSSSKDAEWAAWLHPC
jgi:hypothetical protein